MNSGNGNMIHDISAITGVQFGIYSPEELLRRSVAHITESTLYDSSGEPKIGGLFDPRMGYIEQNKKCKTCEQTYIKCPGHFGHIELAKPIFNMQYDGEIVKLLKCFCIKCSRILVNINHQTIRHIIASTKGNNKERFDKMFKFITGKVITGKVKICGAAANKGDGSLFDNGGCGAIQPTKYTNNIKKSAFISVTAEWRYDSDTGERTTIQQLSAEIVLAIFKRITEEHALAMGLSPRWCMPSWLIMTVLPVVPPCVRPSVRQYNNQRSEDDLTHLYNDIIKINNILKDDIEKGISSANLKIRTDAIQVKISSLFNNDIKEIPKETTRSGRPMKTFAERLGGKEGRIRNNLMGKRVDFSARSVISPDPNLLISELGIPRKIAMNLTFPEVVNKYNIGRMYELVRNGNNVYPGAKSWRSGKNGKTRYIDYNNGEIILEYGDVVNRHLINGDIVLFNRQPSLHKMSMLALEVRVIEGNTFRINPDICAPFNADFDGDEMNMHVPQSIRTAIELKELAASYKHIVSPSTHSAIIRPLQDNLLGLYKITDDSVYFSHTEVMNLLTMVSGFKGVLPTPAINTPTRVAWSGKQIYSIILPPINYKTDKVLIENGILKRGQIPSSVSNPLVLIIFNDYGYKEAARYINDLQKITSRYLIRSGYSVGISDLLVHPDIKRNNEAAIVEAKTKVAELTKRVHLNILEDVTEGLDEIYDSQVQAICGKKFNDTIIAKTLATIEPTNRIHYIVKSGAKGDEGNLQQMMCLLGQQAIDGKRVPLNFHERTLPHYPRYENGIESRGYITSSFLDGLNPQEFFFHAMSGREGIIDTAVKTANSGYLQRRLVKSTEDLKTCHDMSVRASNNDIVEFCYGYDGFNANSLEQQKTGFLKADINKLRTNYYLDIDEKYDDYIDRVALTRMKKNDAWVKRLTDYNNNVDRVVELLHTHYPKFFPKLDELQLYYPVNFSRLVNNAVSTYKLSPSSKCDINPIDVIDAIEELLDNCSINGQRNHTMEILAYDYLAPKNLLKRLNFNRIAFDHVINFILVRFKNSLADGGEMVGPLAAQSIGEKSTQLTLNTFHRAGNAEASAVTQGVTRLNELLGNTKNPKCPQTVIFLDETHRFNREMAEKVQNNIQYTTIGDILLSDAIYLEPNNDFNDILPEDRDMLEIYKIFSELDQQAEQIPANPWLIRLEFDRKKIIKQKITMDDVYRILKGNFPESILMFMDDNAGKLVFRIRIPFQTTQRAADDIIHLKDKMKQIRDIPIKGIEGVTRVFNPKEISRYVKEGASFVERKEFMMETEGSNLFEILMRDGIDTTRTYSIDPNEMFAVFGIEAARYMIEDQIKAVLQASKALTSPRHIGLLCDKMTRQGDFMSVNRHGINKENIGPLAKCSFEETTDQLKLASMFGEFDNIKGVSSNIMVGQVPKCGTGDSEIMLDEEMLMIAGVANKSEEKEEEELTDKQINELFESSKYCEDNVAIRFNLHDIQEEDITLEDIPIVGVM